MSAAYGNWADRAFCAQQAPAVHPGGNRHRCTLRPGHPGTIVVAKIGTFVGHAAVDPTGRVFDTWVSKT